MVDLVNIRTYKCRYAATAWRPMGPDSGPFSRGAPIRKPPLTPAGPDASRLGGGAVDSEHRRAVAPPPPVLSELQDRASAVPTVVRTGNAAGHSDAAGQYAPRGRGVRRAGELHRRVEMIAPHRSTLKLKTQDGPSLRRYDRRWLVERFFAWLQWKRRLLVRWEYYASNFLGFVQLASITMLLRRF